MLTGEPAGLPRSAFDADPATTWVAAVGDRAPWLSDSWGRRLRVDRVTVRRPPGASDPLRIRVEGDRGQWREALVGGDGRLSFKPMTTTRITLRFPAGSPQIIDVTVPGVAPLRAPAGARIYLPCGFGPRLTLNGAVVPTRASGTYADLLDGRPMSFQACRAVKVKAGDNGLAPVPFDAFRIDSAVVRSAGAASPAGGAGKAPGGAVRVAGGAGRTGRAPQSEPSSAAVSRWTPDDRRVEVDARRESYLVVNENFNDGWRARIGGRTLRPARIDGWRQAWVVPVGTTGTVRLSHRPGRTYQAALVIGLGLLVLVAIAALWPVRRWPGGSPPVGEASPVAESLPAGEASPAVEASLKGDASLAEEPSPVGEVSMAEPTVRGKRRGRTTSAVAVVLTAAGLGFWTGGLAAMALTTGAAAAFGWAPARLRVRILSPLTIAGAMATASVSLAIGLWLETREHTGGGIFAETLPQSLCLIALARLVVALRASPASTPAGSTVRREPDEQARRRAGG